MAKKITVAEEVNDFGQQVFAFSLPNGRTLKLEFCQHLIEPDGDACVAAASLVEQSGERIPIAVNDIECKEKKLMKLAYLWFSTREEDERHGQMVGGELNALKDQLAPLVDAEEMKRKHKSN